MAVARALGLSRAITACTQPYSQQLSGDLLRALQKYLQDSDSVDTVYYALLDRALADPVSAAVVAQVVVVLKQLLLRYIPSPLVLVALANFCRDIPATVSLQPSDLAALQYVATCVQRLHQVDASGQAKPSTLSNSSSGALGPMAKFTGVGAASGNRHNNLQTLPTVPSGPLSPGTGSINYDSPSRMLSSRPTMSPSQRPGSATLPPRISQDGTGGVLLLPDDPGALPTWALQPPALLPELLGMSSYPSVHNSALYRTAGAGPGATPSVTPDTRWIDQVPELNPSLAPSTQTGSQGAPRYSAFMASASALVDDLSATSAAAPISVSQLVRCVLDLAPEEQTLHLDQVTRRLRAEANRLQGGSEGGVPAASGGGGAPAVEASGPGRPRASGRGAPGAGHHAGQHGAGGHHNGHKGREKRKRTLYHHPAYLGSDPLQMNETDIAVVVQVVCGAAAAHALLSHEQEALEASWDSDTFQLPQPPNHQPPTESAQQGPGIHSWEDEFDNGDLGQVCGAILVKLIIDMWSTAGPENSYLLVLRMLRKTLASKKPQLRARVFDLLYNLSLHATLLEPCPGPLPNVGSATRTPNPSRPPSTPGNWVPAGAHVHAPPPPAPRHSHSGAAASAAVGNGRSPHTPPSPTRSYPAASTARADAMRVSDASQGSLSMGPGAAYHRLCAWLRALLFQLLEDLAKAQEEDEKVWQAALSALLQLCASGGQWVASYVEALPLEGLAGVLHACVAFRWSPDLHSHLIRLASVLLVQNDTQHYHHHHPVQGLDASTLDTDSIADSAADMEAPSSSRVRVGQGGTEGQGETRVAHIPRSFGGLQGILDTYTHAPCTAACLDLLTVLVHYLTPDSDTESELAQVIASRGAPLFATALQSALRAPRQGMALRLSAAMSGVGIASAPSKDTGATAQASSAAATIRALGGTPAAAAMLPGSHMTVSAGGPPGGGGAAVLPPAGARLILGMLTVIENQALVYKYVLQRSPQLAAKINATVSHIASAGSHTSGSHTPGSEQVLSPTPATLAAAWQDLKDACSCIQSPASPLPTPASSTATTSENSDGMRTSISWPQSAPLGIGGGSAGEAGVSGAGAGAPVLRSLRSARSRGRSQNELRSSMVLMSPPTAACAGRQVALHWLHEVLLQALRLCQGNPLLLTPLNLRTSDAGKLPGASTLVLGLRGSGQAGSQQNVASSESPAKVSSWSSQLADVLLHCVREVVGGCSLLVAAMARAVTDLKQNVLDSTVRHHLVMTAYYITLLWVMQSGDVSPGSDSHKAAQELADQVLAAIAHHQSPPPSDAPAPAGPGQSMTSAFLRTSRLFSSGFKGAGMGGAGVGSAGVPGVYHLSTGTALVTGQADFAPEPLQATAPELLVALIRSCAPQRSHTHSVQRGLYGRPHPAAGGHGAAGGRDRTITGDGSLTGQHATGPLPLSSSSSSLPRSAWEDPALDRRLALLMALMARCMLDPDMFAKYGLSHLVKEALLPSEDPRERYYAGVYLLRHWQLNQQDKYWRMLRQLVLQAQQLNDDTLLDNPYLTVVHMLNVEGQG